MSNQIVVLLSLFQILFSAKEFSVAFKFMRVSVNAVKATYLDYNCLLRGSFINQFCNSHPSLGRQ